MRPLVLLDIDGVLNPGIYPGQGEVPELVLSGANVARVRRLSVCGRIAWVSTWPATSTAGLEAQLRLGVVPLRVTLVLRPGDRQAQTPKLRSVDRWLARMETLGEADWDSVVWIDDVLGPDARAWARNPDRPTRGRNHYEPALGRSLSENPRSGMDRGQINREG